MTYGYEERKVNTKKKEFFPLWSFAANIFNEFFLNGLRETLS